MMGTEKLEYCSFLTAPLREIDPSDPNAEPAGLRKYGKEELFLFLEKVKGVGRPTIADHFTFLPLHYRDHRRDYNIIVYENGVIAVSSDADSPGVTGRWSEAIDYITGKF